MSSESAAGIHRVFIRGCGARWVLVLDVKTSSFKETFSLLIHLPLVLMQTNSSWKAARVDPRSLRTVTRFLATWD